MTVAWDFDIYRFDRDDDDEAEALHARRTILLESIAAASNEIKQIDNILNDLRRPLYGAGQRR